VDNDIDTHYVTLTGVNGAVTQSTTFKVKVASSTFPQFKSYIDTLQVDLDASSSVALPSVRNYGDYDYGIKKVDGPDFCSYSTSGKKVTCEPSSSDAEGLYQMTLDWNIDTTEAYTSSYFGIGNS
jgi:hypothetical protein